MRAKVLCVARSADKLKETVDAIQAAGGQAVAVPCDVTDRASIASLFEQVEKITFDLIFSSTMPESLAIRYCP